MNSQLIREDNKTLDKTYVYEYNGFFDSSLDIGEGAYYCHGNYEKIVVKISK
jgi:hypothetical protein